MRTTAPDRTVHTKRRALAVALVVAIVLGLFATSAAWRLARFDENIVNINVDASYHVLQTITAYDRIAKSEHLFLPVMNLDATDKNIPRGATQPDGRGNIIYTSFLPAGFVAPWAFFKVTGIAPSLHGLLVFNLILHAAGAALLCALVWRLAADASPARRAILTILSAASYLFATEALYAYGAVYWHHQLFQVSWIAQLLVLSLLFEKRTPARIAALAALSFAGPMIEWTGYLANVGVFLVLVSHAERNGEKSRFVPFLIVAVTAAAVLVSLAHFAFAASSLSDLLHLVFRRFRERSLLTGNRQTLTLFDYWESFGPLLLIAAAGLGVAIWKRAGLPGATALVLFAATVPMIENLIMLEHAATYHFDRLKLIVPVVLFATVAGAIIGRNAAIAGALAWTAAIAANAAEFNAGRRNTDFREAAAHNAVFLAGIKPSIRPCTAIAQRGDVRGWVVLTLDHGVYEGISQDAFQKLVDDTHACNGIFLKGTAVWPNLYRWTEAVQYQPSR